MKLFHTDTLNLGNQEIMLFPFFFYKQLGFHTIVPIRRKHHRFAKLIMTCRCTHYYLGGLQILPCFWVDGKWMVSVKNQWMTSMILGGRFSMITGGGFYFRTGGGFE